MQDHERKQGIAVKADLLTKLLEANPVQSKFFDIAYDFDSLNFCRQKRSMDPNRSQIEDKETNF